MKAFKNWTGTVAPLVRENIDTDQIIPKQFLTTVSRSGLGDYLFDAWRFEDEGWLGKKAEERKPRQDFILNKKDFNKASILLGGKNFGCGSSREHAAWSLLDYGIRVVIAPDFADIFYNNALTNGLLVAKVSIGQIEQIAELIHANPAQQCTVDLEQKTIDCGNIHCDFDIDSTNQNKLLLGLDAIGETLQHAETIRQFEQQRLKAHPWLEIPDNIA